MKEKGGQVLGTVFAPIGTADFAPYIIQATASGAKLIEVALSGQDTVNAMKQLQEFGVGKNGQSIGNLVLIDTDVHSAGPAVFAGVESVVAFAWNRTPETRTFADRFFKRTGKMPTMFQAGVYSAVLNYLRSVKTAGTKDSKAVLAAMRANPIKDMFAQDATLRPNGLLTHDMFLVRVRRPEEMKSDWDFYDTVGMIRADAAYPPLSESRCPLVHK
jgi:branched-chain amino acid transport system substrate-binding protein